MTSRWAQYNATHADARKTSRKGSEDMAVRRFLTHWHNGAFDPNVMVLIIPTFPAARVPVGAGELHGAPVTVFDTSVRRLLRATFIRCSRVRVGSQCALCSREDGTIVCVPLIYVFQGHLL